MGAAAAGDRVKLALDHHYPTAIAEQLRLRGHDVVAAVESIWHAEPDDALLTLCTAERRALLTNNVADFMTIARDWAAQGMQHAGLIFTSDASNPRTLAAIGRYVKLLDALLHDHPDDFEDRVHWL